MASTPEKVEAPVVGSGNSGGGPGFHPQITVTVNTMETVEAESRAASLARPEN